MRTNLICWQAMPFLRAIIPFIAGILSYGHLPDALILPAVTIAVLILPAHTKLGMAMRYRLRSLPGLCISILLFCAGHLAMDVHDLRNDPSWLGHNPTSPFIGFIASEPRVTDRGTRFEIQVFTKKENGRWAPAKGKIMVYTQTGAYTANDTLLILTRPSDIRSANSGYVQYLARRNIYHSLRLTSDDHILSAANKAPGFVASIKKSLLEALEKSFPHKDQLALAQALLLGMRSDMDPEILSAYTNTGVVHVIAISGMHLALIYGMITILLKPLKNRKTRIARILIILFALWLFALLCGASPSVVRSAVMFSFVLVGEAIDLDHQPGNTLAGSAFLLLCLEPVLLWDIGFQLSYAAVASLMLYSKPISQCYMPENRILANAWGTISTTLAAQILTTPLAIFHFGQFPILFLLANLVAVPLSGIILILLFVVCILHHTGLAAIPAAITSSLMDFMNNTIIALDSVNFSSLKNIHIQWYDAVNIYIVIISLTLWLRSKK